MLLTCQYPSLCLVMCGVKLIQQSFPLNEAAVADRLVNVERCIQRTTRGIPSPGRPLHVHLRASVNTRHGDLAGTN